jgi:hypothetical protein
MLTMGDIQANTGAQPTAWYQNVLQQLSTAATTYLTLEQQRELIKIQNDRLRQGLPPLDVSDYTPGVSVGVAPSTRNALLLALAVAVGAYLIGKAIK